MFPLYCDPTDNRIRVNSRPRQLLKWKIFSCGFLWTVLAEMTYFAYIICQDKKKESIPFLLLNSVCVSLHLAGFMQAYSNLLSCQEFCQFFESVMTACFHPDLKKKVDSPRFWSAELWVNLVICCFWFCSVLCLPLLVFVFPGEFITSRLISDACSRIFGGSRSFCISSGNMFLQFFSWMLEVFLNLVSCILSTPLGILFAESIGTVCRQLRSIQQLTRQNPQWRYISLVIYRKLQIATNVLNECLQLYTLPSYQVSAAGGIMASLYAVLMTSRNSLHPLFYLVSLGILVELVLFICIILELGSSQLSISNSFLTTMIHWKVENTEERNFHKRYVRSLHPLKIYMGPFHVLDSGRAPALMRFCIQRTVFFMVQSPG